MKEADEQCVNLEQMLLQLIHTQSSALPRDAFFKGHSKLESFLEGLKEALPAVTEATQRGFHRKVNITTQYDCHDVGDFSES